VNYPAGLDGVAAALADAAGAAFGRFLDPFCFVGGGAAVSAAGLSCDCSLITAATDQH